MSVYIPVVPMRRDKDSNDLIPVFALSPARTYGELKVLLPRPGMLLAPSPVINQLKRDLKDFCDDDFLLPVGDPAAIAAATMVAAQMNRGTVNILVWDRRVGQYVKTTLTV